jgi:hypothetical protein
MRKWRKSWLSTLCVGTLFVFFTHLMFLFADQSGLVPCFDCEHTAHHDTSAPEKVPQSDCYLVHLNDEMIIEDLVTLPVHSYMVGMAISIDAFASQGPVREIDHPPQLS